MDDPGDILGHSVFGDMEWVPEAGVWFGELEQPSGARLGVTLKLGNDDPDAFIELAAELFWWAVNHERQVRRKAIRAKLLKLYNDGYRADSEEELSEKRLAAGLKWQELTFKANKDVVVEFNYEAGDLFNYRRVSITVDSEFVLRRVALAG